MQALGPKIIDETSVTGDVYSKSLFSGDRNGFSMTYRWNTSGNLVAALKLQCRNNRDEDFVDCNLATFPEAPDGIAGNNEYAVVDTYHREYRVHVDFTSGDGTFEMWTNIGQ